MKKFLKLVAVLSALILVLAYLAGCKNNSSSSKDDVQTLNNPQQSNSNFEGLWVFTNTNNAYDDESGYYITGNKFYVAEQDYASESDQTLVWWYVFEIPTDEGKISVDGNSATIEYYNSSYTNPNCVGTATINSGIMTIKWSTGKGYSDCGTETLRKITPTPTMHRDN